MTTQISHSQPGAGYMDLIREFPLKPLRTAGDYDAAVEMALRFGRRHEADLSEDEQDYLDVLVTMIEEYDRQYSPRKKGTPLEIIKFLMEQRGMNTADLGRVVGNRGLASQILHGKRQISKMVMRKLAQCFDVSPALFLD